MTWPFTDPPNYATTDDDTGPELRLCVSRSVGEQSLERETLPRRSGGCGKALILEDSQQPVDLLGARPPCKRKQCPDCGPVENAKRLRHFLALMDGHQMRRRPIEPAARRATLAKLRRAGHCWVPIPSPDGMLVLWATGGIGELVTDVEVTLAADLEAAPVGRPIVPSRGWSRQPVATRGQGRFKLVGQATAPMPQVVQAFKDADAYRGQVPIEALPPEWAEAHLFTRPADELAWQRLKRRIGLHWPEPPQRRPGGRASAPGPPRDGAKARAGRARQPVIAQQEAQRMSGHLDHGAGFGHAK